MEFMAGFFWCGTTPHVHDGELEGMVRMFAKNNWLLYCGAAQIVWVSQYVIRVCIVPAVQSISLVHSGKLSFLLAGSLYVY